LGYRAINQGVLFMIEFVKPQERYINSYWETFDTICKEKIYLSATNPFPLDSTIEFVKSAINKNIPLLFVIDTNIDRCVGWCDAMPKTEEIGYLGTGLLSEYREKGLGKKLIEEVISLSKEYGYRHIELDVSSSNKRAIHVYEQLGFQVANIVKNGFEFMGNFITEDVTQMKLDLYTK
jgi:ribosomal protein S18 acetylase RimI-like enzyme